jgi:[ribosomal protein S5]-alanine N-acetyltransferase
MRLVLERCTIRPWRLDDAESLARHANNRKIWLAVRDLFPHPYTIQDAHEFLQRTISEGSAMKFCIEIDGVAVGGIGVSRFAALRPDKVAPCEPATCVSVEYRRYGSPH